ncbi:hypothetical protein TNCV_4698561 [Trichonephila clavipes]|nr:hypothetical protein TNCV_4698561 [Trichonephila clavipes]
MQRYPQDTSFLFLTRHRPRQAWKKFGRKVHSCGMMAGCCTRTPSLSVKQFLTRKNITVLGHLPYSPDLAPCNFFISYSQICSKETHFTSVEEIQFKNGQYPEGSSKNIVPEVFPAMAAPNAEVCEC